MKYELQYLALVILLPLIPAYLLYRTMPSGAWVKGPFKGLKIHLTGAFAGYFILLVTIVSLAFGLMKPLRDEIEELKIRNRYQSWTIEVKKTGLGRIGDNPHNKLIQVVVRPPQWLVFEDGTVQLDNVVVQRNPSSGQLEFPTLILTYPPLDANSLYGQRSVELNSGPIGDGVTVERQDEAHKLTVRGDFSLRRSPQYQPQVAPEVVP